MLIRVALPVPLYREFDYLPSANNTNSANTLKDTASNVAALPPIGGRVQVSFGRQTLIGIVVDHIDSNQSDVPLNKLKAIKQVIDTDPILDLQMLSLARWLASYYHYPLGDVLSVMLPTLIRQGKPLDMLVTHWRILPNVSEDDFHSNAHKQKQQFAMLKLHGEHGASEDTLLLEGMERPFLKRLEENGLIEHFLEEQASPRPVTLAKMPLTLNEQQQQAVDKIVATAKQAKYGGFLLNGVTGSGKTEVYLQAMQAILEAGKQVLVLVPEIGLTPQTRARFAARFAANILLLHSGLNVTQRLHGWEDCRQGRAQIIIGTRSSILHPFADLGLIVVDESHDQSYKQQDTLRYHAADVALYRGYQLGIPVVLGTATPSLEHLKLVQDGKLTELLLTQRAGNAKEATMQLVDARDTPTKYSDSPAAPTQQASLLPNLKGSQNTGLTDDTIVAIRETLEAGEQVLVFLNRRGYAPILLCEACGWQADCVRCEAHMTVHHSQLNTQQPSYLKCHHCDWQASIPLACPDCASVNLNAVGMGTTRLTESLHALFLTHKPAKKPTLLFRLTATPHAKRTAGRTSTAVLIAATLLS